MTKQQQGESTPLSQPLTTSESREWADAATYYARFARLPNLLSARVAQEIADCPNQWETEIQNALYAIRRERAPLTAEAR